MTNSRETNGHEALTDKQRRFVDEYTLDRNPPRRRFGRLLGMDCHRHRMGEPEIAQAITARDSCIVDELGITVEFVHREFLAVYRTAMSASPPNLAQANRAMENLARLRGHPSGGGPHPDQNNLPTAEQIEGWIAELERGSADDRTSVDRE